MRIIEQARSLQQGYIAFARWFAEKAGVKRNDLAPGALMALAHLARFCRWGETCFHPDPRMHARLEGRRETLQLMLDYITTEPELLLQIRKIPYIKENDID